MIQNVLVALLEKKLKNRDMKTIELQIDSWVSYSGKAQQVLRISVIDNKVYLSAAGVVDITEVKPITLKKVHLTHNGFKATNAEDTEFVYRDGYEIKVMIDEYIMDSTFLSIEFADKNIWMPIEYVHQLQQAMRLFGIEKEIIL